jgi:hypothetical protein
MSNVHGQVNSYSANADYTVLLLLLLLLAIKFTKLEYLLQGGCQCARPNRVKLPAITFIICLKTKTEQK